jgi:polysaccharide export outer membrane protein
MKTKALKIFIADSDELCGKIYKEQVTRLGYSQVSLFNSLKDCLKNLIDSPDIIFLDQQFVAEDGSESIREIKYRNSNIHIVVFSTNSNMKMIVEAFKQGAFDYVIRGEKDIQMIGIILKEIETKVTREISS